MLLLGLTPPNAPERAIRIGCPLVEQPAQGWDILRETLWVPRRNYLPKGTPRQPPEGAEGLFVVQDERTVEYRGGFPVIELISLGLADGKPAKWTASAAAAEDLSLINANYYSAPWTIWRQSYPRVTKMWIAHQPPNVLDHVSVPSVPEQTFGLPATAWELSPWVLSPAGDLWQASGWVGESRNVDTLPGAEMSLVVDTWLYDPGYVDRNEGTVIDFP